MDQKLLIPGAIVITGVIIAGAVVFSGGGSSTQLQGASGEGGHGADRNNNESLEPVSADDHVRGNRGARVSVVEFSDFECPFCARLHPTLRRVVDEFGGEVNWVYRHFPLSTIHSRALAAAVASECIAELAGNDAFWTFTDRVFSNQRALGDGLYEQIATEVGVDLSALATCRDDNDIQDRVAADFTDARTSGGTGTPYAVIINNESGSVFPFSGALPYENIAPIIMQALGT